MSHDTARAVATLRGLTTTFDIAFRDTGTFYPRISTMFPSSGADEEYGALGTVPGVREWLGDRVFNSLRAAKFTLPNKEWEDSLAILKNDIDDDRMGMYGPTLQTLAQQAARHPDELMLSTLVAGNSTACVDGQYFFDTDHSWGDSGTQDNDLTGAAATGTTPTEDEFRDAYHECRSAIINFKADNGKPFMQPVVGALENMMCLIPADKSMELAAHKAFGKTLVDSGETNIILDRPEVVTSPFLTDTATFYVFYLGAPLKPFVFQARRPLRRQMKGMDDNEFKDVKFMADARYNVGYLAWWTAVRYQFT